MRKEVETKFEKAIHQLEAEGIDLHVLSADRDHDHNAKVGGAKNSQHLHGTAMDFDIKNLSDDQKQRILEVFRDYGAKGFGVYTKGGKSTGSLHIDFRDGAAAIWGKNGSHKSAHGDWLPEWAKQALNGVHSDKSAVGEDEGDFLTQLIVALFKLIIPGLDQQPGAGDLGNLIASNIGKATSQGKSLS